MRRIVPLLALLAFACGAGAQTSPWYIGGAQTVTHESNLYRLADGADESVISTKADLISSTALLAGLDQPVGRAVAFGQRVYVRFDLEPAPLATQAWRVLRRLFLRHFDV